MAKWNQIGQWTAKENINKGESYSNGDGVRVSDLNNIVYNLIYIKLKLNL